MVSETLHNKMAIIYGSGHVAYTTEHKRHQILQATHKFARNINEIKHLTYTLAHIVDGFGHSANIFGCNMNEYRHMTYRIHFCPWNNFTDGIPYYDVHLLIHV